MNVSGLTLTGATSAVGTTQSAAATAPTAAAAPAETNHVSHRGKMMQELQQLHDTDPAKFKAAMSQIADKLREQAKAGGADADKLNALADKFAASAQSGNMPDLKPPGPPPSAPSSGTDGKVQAYAQHQHSGHHHSGAGAALEQAMSSVLGS